MSLATAGLAALTPPLPPPAESGDDSSGPTLSLRGFAEAKVLRGVSAIAASRRVGRAELTLLSLESYGDGFRMICHIKGPPEEPTLQFGGGTMPHLLFGSITDDLGSEYAGGFGGGGGGGTEWRCEPMFAPAIENGATRLTVRVEEVQWTSWNLSVRSFVETGPWVFDVPLAGMKQVTP